MIFRQIPGVIWATDTNLRILYAEGHVLAIAGVDFTGALGTSIQEFVAAHDLTEPVVAGHLAALAGQPQSFRYEFHGRWFEVLIEPLRDGEGHVVGCVGAAVDITERKHDDEELAASRRRLEEARHLAHACKVRILERARSLLEATINATADGLLVVDREGHITKLNERFLALWQIPKPLAAQRDDEKLLAFVLAQLDDPASFRARVEELYEHPDRESFDVVRFNDGRVFERYSIPQRIGEKVVGRVWSFRDVTERERLLRRALFLTETARLLASLDVEKALASVAHLAVPFMGDSCAVDLLWDGNPRRLFVVSRDPTRPVDPELHNTVLAGHPTVYAVGSIAHMAVPLMVKNSVVGAITFAAPPGRDYIDEDLEFAEELARQAALSVENARLYRHAQEASQARDEFLTVAAHEIRGPITSMQLAVQSLQKGNLPPAAIPQVLDVIDRDQRRLARFVDELLDVGRIHADRLEFTLEDVELGDLVRSVAARSGAELARSGSSLSITTDGRLVGQWDRFRLDQVVSNLLSNAIKFGLGKPISIHVDAHDGRARLVVQDQGIGVAPETREQIFEPFERAVSVRNYGGLGLGLHIVKTIVEGLGGSVKVEGQPGAGSTFIVELPQVAGT
jgi:PAS domain S-box-containing protein